MRAMSVAFVLFDFFGWRENYRGEMNEVNSTKHKGWAGKNTQPVNNPGKPVQGIVPD